MSVTPRARRRLATLAALAVGGQWLPTVAAHSGTTHAGTPHWTLLVLVGVGVAVVGASVALVRRGRVPGRYGLAGLFAGSLLGGFGAVGLVEIQVVSQVVPGFQKYLPLASLLVGTGILVGSLLAGRLFWPDRPRYSLLGILLGVWILYPTMLPNNGLTNPLGYALVATLTVAVAYVVRVDLDTVLDRIRASRHLMGIWLSTAGLVAVFLAFSAGTLTVNPDWGPSKPSSAVVTVLPVADPLVYWPAVEFVFPSVPIAGMVSVGTVLLFGTLGGLVGLNVAVMADQWTSAGGDTSPMSIAGLVSTTGATACCCCAPAMYGVLSALLGTAATPVYWAFLDTSSPLGSLFLAASVLLLLGSLVRAEDDLTDACAAPA